MNTWLLADRFRGWMATRSSFFDADPDCRHEQDEQRLTEPAYPAVIFSADAEPFAADGKTARCTVTATVRSMAQNTTAEQHATLVEEVAAALIGEKADAIAWIENAAEFAIVGYSAAADKMEFEGNRFSTPVQIRATVRQL